MPRLADAIKTFNINYTAGLGMYSDIGVFGEGFAPAQLGPQPFVPTASVPGETRYCSPSGTGTAASFAAPSTWATCISQSGPGDLIIMRGGNYAFTANMLINCSGSAGLPIIMEPYQNEVVVITGESVTPGTGIYLDLTGNFVHIRNVEIKNMPSQGLRIIGADNKVENLYIHDCKLSGIHITHPTDTSLLTTTAQSRNLIKNCLIHNCSDVGYFTSGMNDGENADGISITLGYDNVIENTITHTNSDDGVDVWKSIRAVLRNCVSYNNGYGPNGDGNGFKLGGPSPSTDTVIEHSLSYGNLNRGFDPNGSANTTIRYCTSFNEPTGYNPTSDTIITKCHAESVNRVFGGVGVGAQTDNTWNRSTISPAYVSTEPGTDGFMVPTYPNLVFQKQQSILQFLWVKNFSSTASNPSARHIRINNPTYASATEIYISNRNMDSVFVDTYLDEAKTGMIVKLMASRYAYIIFRLTSDAANMTGWIKYTGVIVTTAGAFHDEEIVTLEF